MLIVQVVYPLDRHDQAVPSDYVAAIEIGDTLSLPTTALAARAGLPGRPNTPWTDESVNIFISYRPMHASCCLFLYAELIIIHSCRSGRLPTAPQIPQTKLNVQTNAKFDLGRHKCPGTGRI